MKLEETLTAYLNHLATSGYSASTIGHRECYLRNFFKALAEAGITTPQEVTGAPILTYLSYLNTEYRTSRGRLISKITYSANVYAIRDFFKWLEETRRILISPLPELPRPLGLDGQIPEALTEDQALILLESCPTNTLTGIRDRAILELLYSTGIRRGELINLNVIDFSPERSELLIIQGKGKKDRMVPVGEYAARYITAYLELVRPWQAAPGETALFISVHNGQRLNPRTINYLVKKAVQRSGVTKRVSPHTLRHSMATHLLRNGADLRHIQAILGHTTVKNTAIYTHLDREDLKQVIKESHPHGRRPDPKPTEDSTG